jgi:dipeptidyl-peptidase-4
MRTSILSLSLVLLLAAVGLTDDAKPAKEAPLDLDFLRLYSETRGFMLGRPVRAKPTPDGKAVLFLRAEAKVPKLTLFEFDVATAKTRQLLTPEQVLKGAEENLSAEEKARRERMRVSVRGFTDYQLDEDGKQVLLSLSGKLYVYDRASGKVKELATGKGTLLDPKFSPDGKQIAYVLDHDIYVYDLASDKEKRVTTGGTEKKPHGLAEFVAQEEMGRFSGYWWSPDGKHIAYQETDHDGVEVWYVADPAHPDQQPSKQYYPRPGKQNAKVRLGIIPVDGGDTVWVRWNRKDWEYLAQVGWAKFGLAICLQSRLQDRFRYAAVDPATGELGASVTIPDQRCCGVPESAPRAVADGKRLLFMLPWSDVRTSGVNSAAYHLRSMERGEEKAWLFGIITGLEKLLAVDEKAGEVYVLAYTEPTQMHIFRADAGTGRPLAQITREPGIHTATFSKNCSIYALTSITLDHMPRTTVHKSDGTLLGELPSVAEEPPLKPHVKIEKVGEGEGFYAAVVRPSKFDPKKRYPVLVYVYGGPKHLQVEQAENRWLLPQWFADQGFIVVATDNRGTPGRGRDWERAVYTKFGSVPLDDQVAGLQALGKKHPEMDLDRVGIYGWSFGGYMSALAVLKRPDIFKAAIAGAPVTDWEDYDTHYTERYMGLPKENAAAYKEASLLTYAAKLERPLLLVHGTADDNVYFRHSLKLSTALFREGKEFELLPLSGLTHMVPDPVVMQRMYGRFAGFFQKHLGTPKKR